MKIKIYNEKECKDVFYNCKSFDIIKFQCLRKEECINLKRCFRMLMVMTRKPRRWLKEYKYVKKNEEMCKV